MSDYIIIRHPPFSQNKNWILFGAIANEMLNPCNAIQQIDLKFFMKVNKESPITFSLSNF